MSLVAKNKNTDAAIKKYGTDCATAAIRENLMER
jgi:hypothetical protein